MCGLSQNQNQLDEHIRNVLTLCAEAMHEKYSDARIILYGSQARGQATEQSDLDLLVLQSSKMSTHEKNSIHDALYEIGLENDIVISALIKSVPDWERPISKATPLYQAIQKEGILVV